MTPSDEEPRTAEANARIAAALDADPDLADELEMITFALDREKRERFLVAFADELRRHERPAAAVLAALTRVSVG